MPAGSCGTEPCSLRESGAGFEDTCGGDTICLCPRGASSCEGSGTCVSAFGRAYQIRVHQLTLADRNPANDCWDLGCAPPDPFVSVTVDEVLLGETPNVENNHSATWDPPQTFDLTLEAGNALWLEAWDEDVADNEEAFACGEAPISAALLRTRDLSCMTEIGSLTADIFFAP